MSSTNTSPKTSLSMDFSPQLTLTSSFKPSQYSHKNSVNSSRTPWSPFRKNILSTTSIPLSVTVFKRKISTPHKIHPQSLKRNSPSKIWAFLECSSRKGSICVLINKKATSIQTKPVKCSPSTLTPLSISQELIQTKTSQKSYSSQKPLQSRWEIHRRNHPFSYL